MHRVVCWVVGGVSGLGLLVSALYVAAAVASKVAFEFSLGALLACVVVFCGCVFLRPVNRVSGSKSVSSGQSAVADVAVPVVVLPGSLLLGSVSGNDLRINEECLLYPPESKVAGSGCAGSAAADRPKKKVKVAVEPFSPVR